VAYGIHLVLAAAAAAIAAAVFAVPVRDATPEEQEMEAEVEALRKQLDELQTANPDETDTISDIKKELDEKERALYTLQVGAGRQAGNVVVGKIAEAVLSGSGMDRQGMLCKG